MTIGSLDPDIGSSPVPRETGQNDEDTHLRSYAPRHTQTLRHPSVRPLIKGRVGRVRVRQARGIAACGGGSVWKRGAPHPAVTVSPRSASVYGSVYTDPPASLHTIIPYM